jgi:hypothetical protein
VNHSAPDPGQWAVTGAYYGGQLFPNASALLDAWSSPGSSHLTHTQVPGPSPDPGRLSWPCVGGAGRPPGTPAPAGRLGAPARPRRRRWQAKRGGASARPERRPAARTRAQVVTPPPQDLAYSSLNFTGGPGRPAARGGAAPQAAARQYLPAGQRFRIARNAVDWLGWSFQARAPRPAPRAALGVACMSREAGLGGQAPRPFARRL